MSNALTNRCRTGLLPLLLALPLLAGSGAEPAGAATPPAFQVNSEYYLKRVETVQKQGFFKEELKRYRSYPHLEKAYRLQRDRRLHEARKEFEAYLALTPEDLRTQISCLGLLDRMDLNDEVIARADIILGRWPGFVPAALFKGTALRKKGDLEKAFAVFSATATAKDLPKEDRIFALSTAADIAIARQNYPDAGRMLTALTEIEKKHAWQMQAGVVGEKSGRLKESMDAYSAARESAGSATEKIAASLALAEVARKANDPERARLAYEAVLESERNHQGALRGLAHLAYQGKRYDEAEKWTVQLVRNGSRPEDREFLANLYLKRNNFAAAIPELKAVVEQQGKKASAETLTALAQAYEMTGKLSESAATYKRIPANPAERGETLFRYGNLLMKMEKFREAGPVLEKTLLADLPESRKSLTHRNLSLVHEKSGRYEKAAIELEKSLLNQPSPGGDTLVRLAVLLNRAGKTEAAGSYLDRAFADPALTDDLKRVGHKEKSVILEKSGQASLAVAELEKSLPPGTAADAETTVRLAVLLHKAGRADEALRSLDEALAEPSLTDSLKLVAWREKGLLLEQKGQRREAALEYGKALTAGDRSPALYLALANLYLTGKNPEQADGYLQKVTSHPEATKSEKCAAEDGFGMNSFRRGNPDEGAAHFATALQLCGDNWQRRYYQGLALYRTGQWEKALEQFLLADSQKKDAATLLGIALCHKELNRPGAAVHYLQSALQEPGGVSPEQVKQINDTLGYLYAEEYAYDKAAEAFQRSLTIAPDQVITLKLAGTLNLAGRTDEAGKILNGIDPDKLSAADALEYNDLKAGLLQNAGKYEEALALLEKTREQQATPARTYALGMLAQQAGRQQQAVEYFQSAAAMEPQRDDYAVSLGYACVADGRLTDAIKAFEVVAARNPGSVKVREELGYLNSRIGRNEQAAEWFRKTLDSFPLMPEGASPEVASREADARRLRSEITKLTRNFNAILYASYRAGKAPNSLLANGEQLSGGLNGQVGLEASYRPPVIGLYNDRILEISGRVFGNLKRDSLNYDENSTQAGIGIRYKFLQSENLWISGERLFKIGKYSLDDWLLRLLYSRSSRVEPFPAEQNRDYYLLYGEIDGYLRSETVAASAEVRKGRAFTLGSDYLLIPHLVLDTRWQSPFNAGGNYLEGGTGVSLKYFFNSTRYENYRDLIDFSINYKHGMFMNRGFHKNVGEYDSTLFSLGLFF